MTPEERLARARAVATSVVGGSEGKPYDAGAARVAAASAYEIGHMEGEASARRAVLAEAAGDCPVSEERIASVRKWNKAGVVGSLKASREEVRDLLAALDHARARVALLLNDSEAYQAGLERGGAEERARVLALIAGRQRIGPWRVLDRLRQAIDPDAYVQCPDCSGTGDETSDGDGTCRRCQGTGKTPKGKPTT